MRLDLITIVVDDYDEAILSPAGTTSFQSSAFIERNDIGTSDMV